MESAAYLLFALVCALLAWLFFDSLSVRFQLKSFLKMGGCIFLATASLATFVTDPYQETPILFFFYPATIALYLLYLGYVFDTHAKFSLGLVLMVIAFFFVRGHLLLALQAGLVALVVLQMAYATQHRDFIPLGVGFVLVAVGEFLKSQGAEFMTSGAFLYLFAALFFGIWWWQYMGHRIRFFFKKPTLSSVQTQT